MARYSVGMIVLFCLAGIIIAALGLACPCQYYEIIQHARDMLGNAEVTTILEKHAGFGHQNP